MNLLLKEIKLFSKSNWWVYIIFLICISIIWKTNTGNIFEITIIFLLHFLGDLFVMMMSDFYKNKDKRKGSIYQIFSGIIFNIIGIYALIFNAKPNYFISNIMFGFTSLKLYFEDIKQKKYKIFNYKNSIILGIFIFIIFLYFGLLDYIGNFIQLLGFILFAIALILDNEKTKYFLSILALFLQVLGGGLNIYNSFLLANIVGVDVSFTLLPLTVFIFYLKSLSNSYGIKTKR
ncbi:MAG: hypothetical protein PHE25_03185 [Candidatus Gracilibacteria bacterium]|nr:hypothetical protein [Candidatus Gracilibacteria bacterium]